MPPFLRCCMAVLIAGFAGYSTIALGLDGGRLPKIDATPLLLYRQSKFHSLEDAGWLKLAGDAGDADQPSNTARDRRRHGRASPFQQKTSDEDASSLDVGPMPAWMYKKTPAVGSPEWKREQQEADKQEREVRQAIEGICRGC